MDKHNAYIPDGHIQSPERTPEWANLPLYRKIYFYRSYLGPLQAQYVDKINVKNIVNDVCGHLIKTAKTVRILENSHDLKPEDINPNHFLKGAHGSGWILDLAQPNALKKGKAELQIWNRIYSQEERQYTYLKPRYFIEEKVNCEYFGLGPLALDIKVNCFYGKPVFLSVQTPDKKRNYYTMDWKHIVPPEFTYTRSSKMDTLIEAASMLSKPFEYVRMDFYIAVDGVYFSEFTFTPKNGASRLADEIELELGKSWL